MSSQARLEKMATEAKYFEGVSSDQAANGLEFDALLDVYLQMRRLFASEFKGLAEESIPDARRVLDPVRAAILATMTGLYSELVPTEFLSVGTYGGVHGVLLSYLVQRVGQPVAASRLRVLTGDQIHTERRVRALKELGFSISWKRVASEDSYVLESETPDLPAAAATQLRKNLKKGGPSGRSLLSDLESRGILTSVSK